MDNKNHNKIEEYLKKSLKKVKDLLKKDDFKDLDNKVSEKLSEKGEESLAMDIRKGNSSDKDSKGLFANKTGLYWLIGGAFSFFTVMLVSAGVLYLLDEDQIPSNGGTTTPDIAELKDRGDVPSIKLENVEYLESGYVDQSSPITLRIEDKIVSDVSKAIKVEPELDYDFDVSEEGESQLIQVTPREALDRNTKYKVSLASNTEFANGAVLGEDLTWNIQTEPDFAILGTTPRKEASNVPLNSTVELEFNHKNISLEEVESAFNISPNISGSFEKYGFKYVFVPGQEFDPATTYEVIIDERLTNSEGETLPSTFDFTFTTGGFKDSQFLPPSAFNSYQTYSDQLIFPTREEGLDIQYELYRVDNSLVKDFLTDSTQVLQPLDKSDWELVNTYSRSETPSKFINNERTNLLHLVDDLDNDTYILSLSSDSIPGQEYNYPFVIGEIAAGVISEDDFTHGSIYNLENYAQEGDGTVTFYDQTGEIGTTPLTNGEFTFDQSATFYTVEAGDQFLVGSNISQLYGFSGYGGGYGSSFGYSQTRYRIHSNDEHNVISMSDKIAYAPGDVASFVINNKVEQGGEILPYQGDIEAQVSFRGGNFEDLRNLELDPISIETNRYGTGEFSLNLPNKEFYDSFTVEYYIPESEKTIGRDRYSIEEILEAEFNYDVTLDKELYRNGESANATIYVTDISGNPMPNQRVKVDTLIGIQNVRDIDLENLMVNTRPISEFNADINTEYLTTDENGFINYSFTVESITDKLDELSRLQVKVVANEDVVENAGQGFAYVHDGSPIVKIQDSSIDREANAIVSEFIAKDIFTDDPADVESLQYEITYRDQRVVEYGTEYDEFTKTTKTVIKESESETVTVESGNFDIVDGSHTLVVDDPGESTSYQITVTDPESTTEFVTNAYEGASYDLKTLEELRSSAPREVTAESLEFELFSAYESVGYYTVYTNELVEKVNFNLEPNSSQSYSVNVPDTDLPYFNICYYGINLMDSSSIIGQFESSRCHRVTIKNDIDNNLDLAISTDSDVYEPGEQVTLSYEVRDDGSPVEGNISLIVVNDAIERIYDNSEIEVNQEITDNLLSQTLSSTRINGNNYSYRQLVGEFRGGGKGSGGGDQGNSTRFNIKDTAFIAGQLTTESDGTGSVEFTLPDNMTQWRVLAIATDGTEKSAYDEYTFTTNLDQFVEAYVPAYIRDNETLELRAAVTSRVAGEYDLSIECEGCRGDTTDDSFSFGEFGGRETHRYFVQSASYEDITLTYTLTDSNSGEVVDAISKDIDVRYIGGQADSMIQTDMMYADDVSFDLNKPTEYSEEGSYVQVTVSNSVPMSELTDDLTGIGQNTFQLSTNLIKQQYIYENYDSLRLDVSRDEILQSMSDNLELLLENQADNGGFSWYSYDAVNVQTSVAAAEAFNSLNPNDIYVDQEVRESLVNYFTVVLDSDEYTNADKISALYGISLLNQDLAYVNAQIVEEIEVNNPEILQDPLAIAYIVKIYKNIESEGQSYQYIQDLYDIAEKEGAENDRTYWMYPEDRDNPYRLTDDFVTSQVYTAIEGLPAYVLLDSTQEYLLVNGFNYDEAIEGVDIATILAKSDLNEGVKNVNDIIRITSGSIEREFEMTLENDSTTFTLNTEELGDSINVSRGGENGSVFVVVNEVYVRPNTTPSDNDLAEVDYEILDSNTLRPAAEIREGDELLIKVEVTPTDKDQALRLNFTNPTGFESYASPATFTTVRETYADQNYRFGLEERFGNIIANYIFVGEDHASVVYFAPVRATTAGRINLGSVEVINLDNTEIKDEVLLDQIDVLPR